MAVNRIVPLIAVVLAACGGSSPPAGGVSGGGNGGGGNTDANVLKAISALPPGQSGQITTDGQAQGMATMDPGAYGEHVDDQRLLYWSLQYKDGGYQKNGTPLVPKDGVEIYLDAYGVPAIYADSVSDLWYGAGYIAAKQRLFLLDGARRMGRGTLAELTGCGGVPADLQQRILTYSDAEYQTFFDGLSQDAKDAVDGYIAGANARINEVTTTASDELPAEYALLSSVPQPLTRADILAEGVLITRTVAAEGGNEFQNIRMLKLLQDALGAQAGRDAFQDMVWQDDALALSTVPASQTFSNQALPPGGREAAFNARADWALGLPETIWKGPGTGNAAPPAPCGTALPLAAAAPLKAELIAAADRVAHAADALEAFRRGLHGGSYAVALAGSRTRDGGGLLISGPQLGYTYPTLLYELEIHGAGYNARGVSVPGLPVVGIGYSEDLAWALTTGYSKTIDSFIETICSTAEQQASTCTANQYFHNGQWKDMDCRVETFNYRASSNGVPFGPPALTQDYEICRSVHGPIVARDEAAGLARSLQYAMWLREIDNIEGIREWNRAKTLADFTAAAATLTWNENATVATKDGQIAYFHPGLYPVRAPAGDQRFPLPGTGEFDHAGYLPFAQMPQSSNPQQGFLVNWNTKPAIGWLDGEGISPTSRPGGPGQRATILMDLARGRSDWTFDDLKRLDAAAGKVDPRAREYLPQMLRLLAETGLSATEQAALTLLAGWNREHYGPDIDIEDENATDGPAATIFGAWVEALRDELFGFTQPLMIDTDYSVFDRERGVGSHVFDMSAMDNLIVRVLDPSTSALTTRGDYLGGRSASAVLRLSLKTALGNLAAQFGTDNPPAPADLDSFRRVHPRSTVDTLTGVIGPSGVTMPYQDRGSWVHLVGYERP